MKQNAHSAAQDLHQALEQASSHGPEARLKTLELVLASRMSAVIRRIPELLLPLSAEEEAVILAWANDILSNIDERDVSDRDFICYLLVNCRMNLTSIAPLLETYSAKNQEPLIEPYDGIKKVDVCRAFNDRFCTLAESLLLENVIASRDRGRHMLITAARVPAVWCTLAFRLGVEGFDDLRQGVLIRFLNECPDREALEFLVDKLVARCLMWLEQAKSCGSRETTYMHWVALCLFRLDRATELDEFSAYMQTKFGARVSASVEGTVLGILTQAVAPTSRPRQNPNPTNIEGALADGWTIKSESGRQVVLSKNGRSITLYHPKPTTTPCHSSQGNHPPHKRGSH